MRCAPPSPVLRPRSRISHCFCSFAAPRASLCRPLPLRPRASDIARAGNKVAPDPDLHAARALLESNMLHTSQAQQEISGDAQEGAKRDEDDSAKEKEQGEEEEEEEQGEEQKIAVGG